MLATHLPACWETYFSESQLNPLSSSVIDQKLDHCSDHQSRLQHKDPKSKTQSQRQEVSFWDKLSWHPQLQLQLLSYHTSWSIPWWPSHVSKSAVTLFASSCRTRYSGSCSNTRSLSVSPCRYKDQANGLLLLQVYVWWKMLEEEEHCYRKSTCPKRSSIFLQVCVCTEVQKLDERLTWPALGSRRIKLEAVKTNFARVGQRRRPMSTISTTRDASWEEIYANQTEKMHQLQIPWSFLQCTDWGLSRSFKPGRVQLASLSFCACHLYVPPYWGSSSLAQASSPALHWYQSTGSCGQPPHIDILPLTPPLYEPAIRRRKTIWWWDMGNSRKEEERERERERLNPVHCSRIQPQRPNTKLE